ncbi:MAG: hypothetical protein HYZ53_01630 [Planctomycetes bacterium]|nr:hypothetical protein [Planctomycetota bacterium]
MPSPCLLRFAAALLCAPLVLGCYRPKPEDPGRTGRDGWLLYLEKPGEYLTAVRDHASLTVRAKNTDTFLIVAEPRDLAFPVPPGATYQEGTYQVIQQEFVYTLPPGRTFEDVYEWYRAWYGFGRREPARDAARR